MSPPDDGPGTRSGVGFHEVDLTRGGHRRRNFAPPVVSGCATT